ncbi:hypothetical protein EVAR_27458_1 [Eumeta japonica]|uniref:Uncharacterized protein n=1 Tax=Eumeta variegata TaxID=151549 RepID=A0A4C1VJ14_EUMVA|nr:hypothetical protein EVAR_27458_1 [Eumeta japonica]
MDSNAHILFDNFEYNEHTEIILQQDAILVSVYWNEQNGCLVISPDIDSLEANPYTVETKNGVRWNYQYSVELELHNHEEEMNVQKNLLICFIWLSKSVPSSVYPNAQSSVCPRAATLYAQRFSLCVPKGPRLAQDGTLLRSAMLSVKTVACLELEIQFDLSVVRLSYVRELKKLRKKWDEKHKALLSFVRPPIGVTRYHLILEIVSTIDFEEDNLYVEYEIKRPGYVGFYPLKSTPLGESTLTRIFPARSQYALTGDAKQQTKFGDFASRGEKNY